MFLGSAAIIYFTCKDCKNKINFQTSSKFNSISYENNNINYYFHNNKKSEFDHDYEINSDPKNKILKINFIQVFSSFILGIPYWKLNYFFLLCGLNFLSEQSYYKYLKRVTTKIAPITEKSLQLERENYCKVLFSKFQNFISENLNDVDKNIIPAISFDLPIEIVVNIYSFLYGAIYLVGSTDGRYDKRRGASNCSMFFFDLNFTKKILFFSNSSRLSLRKNNGEEKIACSSNMLEP